MNNCLRFITDLRTLTDSVIHDTLLQRPEIARVLREEAGIIESVCEHDKIPSQIKSDKGMDEFQFLKHLAEMRGTCDECKKSKVMIALSNDDKWRCFDCSKKIL